MCLILVRRNQRNTRPQAEVPAVLRVQYSCFPESQNCGLCKLIVRSRFIQHEKARGMNPDSVGAGGWYRTIKST